LSLRLAVVSVSLVFAVACGGGYSSPTEPSTVPSPMPAPGGPSSAVTIPAGAESLGHRAYRPTELNVAVGTTVTWMNMDSVSHTSTSDMTGRNSGSIAPGGRLHFFG
jgi:hypothetical protein